MGAGEVSTRGDISLMPTSRPVDFSVLVLPDERGDLK